MPLAVFFLCVFSHSHGSRCLQVASKVMRSHGGAAALTGLQRCDAVSLSKQSLTFQTIIVSVYSGSNHKLLDHEGEGITILQSATAVSHP
jgi:hypothetical protein